MSEQAPKAAQETPFSSNEVQLSLRQWLLVCFVVAVVLVALPKWWRSNESLEQANDFRIPFVLSNDYWIYESVVERTVDDNQWAVVGDSVVWGEYVRRTETLSAALNRIDSSQRYANCGISGMHCLALEGLVANFARSLRDRHVILHCNLLWLSSPERDLSLVSEKAIEFNHPSLVPQLTPIPAYKAKDSERLNHLFNRTMPFRKLVLHLRASAYDNMDLPTWTLEHPYENPLTRVSLTTPVDTRVGKEPMASHVSDIPWMTLDESLQWKAFQRTVMRLRERGNRLFVVLGPYNEHLLTESSRERYDAMKKAAIVWFEESDLFYCAPDLLPAAEYGDASHPLADGYRRMAEQIDKSSSFQAWKEVSD